MPRRHRSNQDSVAIGRYAGEESTTENTVSIGRKAGYSEQSQYAIAIGDRAGEETQGLNAIAIGSRAGLKDQPDYSIIICTDGEIKAKKKGLYIDPIRNFDDRTTRPATVGVGNMLTYNFDDTKEIVVGFPRLPAYPNDAEVQLAFAAAKTSGAAGAGARANGTLYFDTTKKKVKVWVDTKWLILLDEANYAKIKELLPALPAL